MPELIQNPLFPIYSACAVILAFNLVILAGLTAANRSKAGGILNPEDAKLNQKGKLVDSPEADPAARFVRAHRNALENIPLFLITSFVYILVAPSFTVAASMLGVFTAARWLHSLVYLAGKQPWRTMFFGIGQLTQVALLIHWLIVVFGGP